MNWTVLTCVLAVPVGLIAAVVIRFNLKRRHIISCTSLAKDDQLENVYRLLESIGTEPPTCAVLARTNGRISSDDLIPVPSYVEPWGGRALTVDAGKRVVFRFVDRTASCPVLRGQVYRIVPVPRHQTKTGKGRNQFSPSRYLAKNPNLLSALTEICPRYPADLLSYLLSSGMETFEFDPINQARIGGSPSWVQDAEFPNCDQCKKRMNLILQLPGTMLPGKPLSEGTFFFFGCVKHMDQTKTVEQYS